MKIKTFKNKQFLLVASRVRSENFYKAYEIIAVKQINFGHNWGPPTVYR